MMATIDERGIRPRDLTGYKALFEERFRERFGEGIALESETPQGQIIGIMSLAAAEMDESLVSVANGLSVRSAAGRQLDDLATLLHVARLPAQRSVVIATLSGVPGTVIPAGSVAATADDDEFASTGAAQIGAAGSVDVEMHALAEGAVAVAAGALSRVRSLVDGWETVTNAAAARVGKPLESDYDFRRRYMALTANNARTNQDALIAALTGLGLSKFRIEENYTNAAVMRQGVSIPAHSIAVIVHGAVNAADLAAAILEYKGMGVGMSGTTTTAGASYTVATATAIQIDVSITTYDDFPADGVAQIKSNLVDYAANTFDIGDALDLRRLQTPINAVAAHTITALAVTDSDSNALPAVPALANIYTLAAADITVTVAAD